MVGAERPGVVAVDVVEGVLAGPHAVEQVPPTRASSTAPDEERPAGERFGRIASQAVADSVSEKARPGSSCKMPMLASARSSR